MLSREQANERLKEFRVSNWARRKRRAISRLPGHLEKVFSHELQSCLGQTNYSKQNDLVKYYLKGFQWLESTSNGARKRVFRVLFPEIAVYVNASWDLFQELPYLSGMKRKAFRCPHNSAVVRLARMQWILTLFRGTSGYNADIQWLAEWAPYLTWGADRALGVLFAAAINKGDEIGERVFQILVDSAKGEHPIGAMGSHIVRALLISSREDGWKFIESLLLAAQRQEGLRQYILESVDESHPEAYIRMLRLILDENLVRFSSVFRAANVWFGLYFDVGEKAQLRKVIRQVLDNLTTPQNISIDKDSEDALSTYLCLWAIAFYNAENAIKPAAQLIHADEIDMRFVGVHLLSQLNLMKADDLLLEKLDDPDLSVATKALLAFDDQNTGQKYSKADLFERIERNIKKFPKKKKTIKPHVFPWMNLPSERSTAARILIYCLGRRSPKRLVPYLKMMNARDRVRVAGLVGKKGRWDNDKHTLFMNLLSDRSSMVRERAIIEISKRKIESADINHIESLLSRKSGDLRRGLITILLKQRDKKTLASAERLLSTGDRMQRLAGLEMIRLMLERDRSSSSCRKLTERYTTSDDEISTEEQVLIKKIEDEDLQTLSLEDGLGLFNPEHRTQPTAPRPTHKIKTLSDRKVLVSPAAEHTLLSLDNFVHAHRTKKVVINLTMGSQEELLGNIRRLIFYQKGKLQYPDPTSFSLSDLLNIWWEKEGSNLIDNNPMMLLEALALLASTKGYMLYQAEPPIWQARARNRLFGKDHTKRNLEYSGVVQGCLEWLIFTHLPLGATDFLLDAFELTLRMIPKKELARKPIQTTYHSIDWRSDQSYFSWLWVCREHREMFPEEWQAPHHVRLWGLLRWMDEPGTSVPRFRPTVEDLLPAYLAGGVTEADVIDHLIGSRTITRYGGQDFYEFCLLSRRNPLQLASGHTAFMDIVEKCRKRICEVELGRGDMPTVASNLAISLRWSGGGDTFIETLKALGKTKLVRGWLYDSKNKASVLSRILRVTYPGPEDTKEVLKNKLSDSGLPRTQLIQVAVYAPQWAEHIEYWLEWDGFSDAVWWIHAHTKDTRWSVEQEIREAWIADINSRTPLTAADLIDGAVDVSWFNQTFSMLGSERWNALYKAAVYASGGNGHTRAKQFADAMLGKINKEDLLNRIIKKRHQDSIRALGLIPLPKNSNVDSEILERYQALQEFKRTSRQFGSQRQTSEKLAVRIAMENLARTAGFPDPARLQWAMESDEIADLAAGPIGMEVDGVEFTLAINSIGEPDFLITRGGKSLKSVPAKMRTNPQIKELRGRKTAIKRQASRMRSMLEGAMCRGDGFCKNEFIALMEHPVLKPMISQLVFTSDEGGGYLTNNGKTLQGLGRDTLPTKMGVAYRIAHPIDLLQSKQWHTWQRDCFLKERIQPFKQIFRELYLLTPQEKNDGDCSRRYAGHQVNPRQALALLGKRGWITKPEAGIQRTFHDERITVHLSTESGYLTPQEIEGITIDSITFTKRDDWNRLPLDKIPPRVFSEAMRDIDLVVSVAHMGGVDPEASASTVEMRLSILQETFEMLGIGNVELKGTHAIIGGELRDYSVHLGSAVVHMQPGGSLCIVPVHAHHRGRIFLPFVDDDPRTAEVISKVLLLAKDKEIKDPTILEQILH